MIASPSSISRSHQRGAALLVAVVFLLLAGIMTLFALNVGVFETRSTGNDIRSKMVNEVAEAGLSRGFEYLMRQQSAMLEDSTLWRLCGANELTYPCGAVLGTVDHDLNAATAEIPRRSTMWRLVNSGHTDTSFDAAMTGAMLDLPNPVTNVGGFPVNYGVAPVVCFVQRRAVGELNSAPIRCAQDLADAGNRRIATFVSVARVTDEGARTTLAQTVGRFNLVDDPVSKPPVIASGSVDITGGLQLVTNPNAGGPGVPVSVWTRKNVDKTGTPNTCYADEFFRFGAKNNTPPGFEGSTITCDTCQCDGDKSLSYDKSGNVQTEGIDILDVEGDSATPPGTAPQIGINHNVKSDAKSWPLCEFPPDLFGHVFGTQAWSDEDHDCFAEKKVMQPYTNPNTGVEVTMGADEAFLYSYAQKIINPTATGAPLVSNDQKWTGAYPSTALSGLIWCQSTCDIGSNTQLGTADNPVVIVIDGSAKVQGRIFGLVVIRSLAGGATLTPVAGYTFTAAEVAAGGNAVLDMNAGAVVYGAMVVQGKVDKANGTAAIVHDSNVLNAIGKNPNNSRYATLPGAWNDTFSY